MLYVTPIYFVTVLCVQVQAGRPPGSKDVNYDDRGNVISVVRLDPDKLPSHR